MIIKLIVSLFIFASSLLEAQELTVYSHRNYYIDKKIYEMFEEDTGIKINLLMFDSSELIKKIQAEGKDTLADVLVTVDATRLVYAQYLGLLQKVKSDILEEKIPSHLRQKDGYWYGLTKRARIIAYNKNKVKASELSTYDDLTSSKWKGELLVGSSNDLYNLSLLSLFIANEGEEVVSKWASGIVKNMARTPSGSDIYQIKALASKRGDLAIVNTYYIGKLLNSKKSYESDLVKDLGIFFPDQGETQNGTHVNISGMGLVKHSKNKENAIKFLEFMLSDKVQKLYAKASYEYPINPKVEPSKLLKSWGKFKENKTNLEVLGYYNNKAVKIFKKVDWK